MPSIAPTSSLRALTAGLLWVLCACSPDSADLSTTASSPVPAPSSTAPSSMSPSASPAPLPSPPTTPTETAAATASPVDGPLARDLLTAGVNGPVRFEVSLADPTSPAALARALVASEEAVRDVSRSEDARLVAAHRVQRGYRQLARTPAWQGEVLMALPDRWRFVAAQNLAAREALDRLRERGEPPTTLPAWEIVAPEPADELLGHYREAEDAIGRDWELLAAINLVETRMGRIVGFSTAQARGPMQFIPESWELFGAGGDIDDARDAIMAAARHLNERPGDPPGDRGALLRYNRSSDYGDAVLAIAEVLREDPTAYASYHGWQVYYGTPQREFLLPVGYREEEPVPIADYLARPALEVSG